MKFNIANRLDIELLNRKLDDYACSELRNDFYIFMSPDTLAHMPEPNDYYEYIRKLTCNDNPGRIESYHGHKVFSDPSMKYGDVEFR